jgi:hypothetical protein
MDMNRLTRQVIMFVAGMIAFFFMLGIAGKCDYQEAVMQSISCAAYDEIVEKVGNDADDVIEEYRLHQSYYDSIE